ncbi:MAG: uroporphyrinogen-III C-methyltransferase [Bacillota bacterium]
MENIAHKRGIVYLVGAGPGDYKLLTIKGQECIARSDVIIYDRLVSRRILGYAPVGAELIFAGKSPGNHNLEQDKINALLVQKASENKVVTRLKGGDPFVFGRGGEEAEVLHTHGIPFEIVPGVTSAIATPAYAGIPVTHRDYASSVAIITGNEDPTRENGRIAWEHVARENGTLVFLMGIRNLPQIVNNLLQNGKEPTTPAAVIRWGTRPEQKTVAGTLADIVDRVAQARIKHPALIVVGEVVKLRQKLRWFEDLPLFGKRIVVTRAKDQAGSMMDKIEALGGEPWEFAAIGVEEPEDFGPMDRSIANIGTYDWIIFTSVNGVEYFFRRMRYFNRDTRALHRTKLGAIGPRTREELESHGLLVDFVPDKYVAEAVAEGLRVENMEGVRVLLPRADIARQVLPETLREQGAHVDVVHAYRTVKGRGDVTALREELQDRAVHAVTFTSSSTARNFAELLPSGELHELMRGVTVASIGPVTSRTVRELGLTVDVEAEEYTVDGLIRALVAYFTAQKP